jgi:hypothetical protein
MYAGVPHAAAPGPARAVHGWNRVCSVSSRIWKKHLEEPWTLTKAQPSDAQAFWLSLM